MSLRSALLLAVCSCLSIVGLVRAQPEGGPPPANVQLDAVRTESVETWREVTGEVRANRRSVLAAEEPGLVIAIDLEPGDRVPQGAVIATLEPWREELELRRAQAERRTRAATVALREAELTKAHRDLERVRASYERASATQTEVDDTMTLVTQAEARLEEARAELVAAEVSVDTASRRLERMTIRSPFNASVVEKRTERGQWVQRGDPLLTVVSLDKVEIWLDVPERFIQQIDPTSESARGIRIRVEAVGVESEVRAGSIIPEADPVSRLFPVRIDLPNPQGLLKPGMSVIAEVPTGVVSEQVTVHKDALLRDDAGEFVYFSAGGVAAVARVSRLFATGDRVAVRAPGLPPGAEVVTEGNERLFPGRPLIVIPAAPPARTPAAPSGEG